MLVKMVTSDFEDFGLVSQDDANLDKETGRFNNNNWNFKLEHIETDLSESWRKYTNGVNTIYLTSFRVVTATGAGYTDYEFYKDV
tara:strand:+ start:6216 stop:6470 length:255 start_codon:yes stop_codon:yes gene_type:complete